MLRSLLGIAPININREVSYIHRNSKLSYRFVCKWVAKFKTGYRHIKDAACQDRPATVITNCNTCTNIR